MTAILNIFKPLELPYFSADFDKTCIKMNVTPRHIYNWAASSEFVSSSIPLWQIVTAHAQPFRGARDLAFCLRIPLDSLLVWASSGGSGETAQRRRLAWTFAAHIGDKYQIRLTRPNLYCILPPPPPVYYHNYVYFYNFCIKLSSSCMSIQEFFHLSNTIIREIFSIP